MSKSHDMTTQGAYQTQRTHDDVLDALADRVLLLAFLCVGVKVIDENETLHAWLPSLFAAIEWAWKSIRREPY